MEQEKSLSKHSEKVICEEWVDIKGYENIYQVSNLGRIKSLAREGNNRTKKDRIMRQYVGKTGYRQVRLCKNNKTKLYKVHILIARAFIDNPYNYPIINHKDGDKLNNEISNLEWCSCSHNIKHSYEKGLRKTKQVVQKSKNNLFVKRWFNISEASKMTNISHSSIWKCCNNQRNTAGGYKWEYTE